MIQGAEVKVPRSVGGPGGGIPLLIREKEEELQLRPHIQCQSHILYRPQWPLQHVPGVPGEGRPVRVVDIADHPGYLAILRTPGQDGERVQIRLQILVGLLHTDGALDGAAVQHDLPVQRPLNLRYCNRHIFQLSKEICKLHPDKLDVLLQDQAEDLLSGVSFHSVLLSAQGPLIDKKSRNTP